MIKVSVNPRQSVFPYKRTQMVFCHPAGLEFYFPRHTALIAVVGLQAPGQTYADFTLRPASLDKPHFGIVHNIRAISTAQSFDPVVARGVKLGGLELSGWLAGRGVGGATDARPGGVLKRLNQIN